MPFLRVFGRVSIFKSPVRSVRAGCVRAFPAPQVAEPLGLVECAVKKSLACASVGLLLISSNGTGTGLTPTTSPVAGSRVGVPI